MTAERSDPTALALRLLARREYGRLELRDRLLRAGCDAGDVALALDALVAAGYQDDARYAEMLVRTRVRQGHGPLRLRQDLRRAGVEASADPEVDWLVQAQTVYQKRFGDTMPVDAKDYARRVRFLAGRGFTGETIRRVLTASREGDFSAD
ncbi:regulatory protein RecX [Acidithiobacillus sp.]|uniref:regulatory protein RecX n=1 Tax=Acidithiobacillus sp. TaxID=1872118 RepID=UPI0025C5BB15|nr:regulatory protein RecX [Acidithiobacillus sp.]MCK9188413.1 RecX family transcriptional regulator [Acidithiobacillus sp.]MCK9358834.1 RecX family transcriptional regulator [Acidithiobacillus sp.]